jgi:hypothetical protein
MRKSKVIVVITWGALLALLFVRGDLARAEDIRGEKKVSHRVVTLHGERGIVPNLVIAPVGSTVIWINYSQSLVEIEFTKKEVTLACREPINFMLTTKGAYVSNKIPSGSVASLCFVERGEYEYRLVRFFEQGESSVVDEKKYTGTIKIQ